MVRCHNTQPPNISKLWICYYYKLMGSYSTFLLWYLSYSWFLVYLFIYIYVYNLDVFVFALAQGLDWLTKKPGFLQSAVVGDPQNIKTVFLISLICKVGLITRARVYFFPVQTWFYALSVHIQLLVSKVFNFIQGKKHLIKLYIFKTGKNLVERSTSEYI